jgi:predicted NAD/FAD-binding protein
MRIAVVGSGIAGLSAAWLLAREHQVTLFEAAPRLGGHTNTVDVSLDGFTHPVDTGFLVFNHRTYPNLTALFSLLGVGVVRSEMSFAVALTDIGLEWSGTSLATLFAQKANLARPAFWGMVQDVLRFNREGTRDAQSGLPPALTLGDYLENNRYGAAFRDWYLLPMASAIWSCPARRMLDYPASTFLRFCDNHGLMQVFDRPQWMTVEGGGRSYVRRIAEDLDDVRLAAPVRRLRRAGTSVWIETDATTERYDQVVLACHSDQALEILGSGASEQERALLGAIRYQPNRAVLHTDAALLPRERNVWSAWNYMRGAGEGQDHPVSVSYLINRLQPLPFARPVVVSLNPYRAPRPETVLGEYEYAHPVFDCGAIDAQARMGELQGAQRTWYCGAWCGFGFHEDGLKSALAIANALGVQAPWQGERVDDLEVA